MTSRRQNIFVMDTRNCYGYVRVSTAQQVLEGSSLQEQERKIRAWAELNNMQLIGMYIDAGVSGTFMFERPEFSKLLKVLSRGDVIATYDTSRISRNPYDMACLLEKMREIGSSIAFIQDGYDTTTHMGRTMAQMASIMHQMEVKAVSERAREAHRAKKEDGKATGRPIYGWKPKDDKKGSGWIEVPEQQEVIRLIRKLRDEDKMSFNAISAKLTSDGVPTPGKGKSWNPTTVTNIYNRKEVATKGRDDI